jgi:uroporphyrinogen decarboxylase
MTPRERITTILRGGVPDRIGRNDSPWFETIARWRKEGLGEQENPADRFEFDFGGLWGPDCSFRFEREVVEETEEYVISRDVNGVLRKDLKGQSGFTPHWYDYKIKTREDWFAHKDRLTPSRERVAANIKEQSDNALKTDKFVIISSLEPYELTWNSIGQVGVFTLMMDDPDLVADMFETYATLIIGLMEIIFSEGADFDGCFVFGDLGYRNATLFSPVLYRELLLPQHKRMCDYFKDHGKPVMLHSCGKIEALIPDFIEAGFAAIQPLEAKTGMDVRKLKAEFGDRITLYGNIDVRKLSGTRADIEEEISSKIPVAMKGGGYIFHSDHSVPPTVSWDNYCYAIELVDKYGRY